jgi:hypothetical protein
LDYLQREREHAVGHFKLCNKIDVLGELWPPPGIVPRIVFELTLGLHLLRGTCSGRLKGHVGILCILGLFIFEGRKKIKQAGKRKNQQFEIVLTDLIVQRCASRPLC